MSWRLATSLEELRDEVNKRWPNRSKVSDGTIGDAAHASRDSDHNPWLNNTVRALDITADGIDAGWYAAHLRKLGAAGDRRLTNGGYVIWNRRITSPDFKRWTPYNGANPHTHHVHVSVSRTGYNNRGSWGIAAAQQEDWWDKVDDKKFIQLVRKAMSESFDIKKLTDGKESDLRVIVQWLHKHVTDMKADVDWLVTEVKKAKK